MSPRRLTTRQTIKTISEIAVSGGRWAWERKSDAGAAPPRVDATMLIPLDLTMIGSRISTSNQSLRRSAERRTSALLAQGQ